MRIYNNHHKLSVDPHRVGGEGGSLLEWKDLKESEQSLFIDS